MGTRLLAATAPLAATAGRPIPGNVESPKKPWDLCFLKRKCALPSFDARAIGPTMPSQEMPVCQWCAHLQTERLAEVPRSTDQRLSLFAIITVYTAGKESRKMHWHKRTRRHRYACSNHIPVLSLDMSMVASILFLYVCMHAEC